MQISLEIIEQINKGAVGIMPTDTIYGIIAKAKFSESVERIYKLKIRDKKKPLIILISDISQLSGLGVNIPSHQVDIAIDEWKKRPASIIFISDVDDYLTRGTDSLAIRLPRADWLIKLIRKTGPIVATSANISGEPFGASIFDIKNNLPGLDFYVEGPVGRAPSIMMKMHGDGRLEKLSR